jgi:hypothetical protein
MAWISLLLVAFATIQNGLPRSPSAHCRATAAETGHHHHQSAKDIDGGGQCPHCPPVECRRHADCSVTADSLVTAAEAARPLPLPAAIPVRAVRTGPSRAVRPPTPPPQSSAALR